MYDNNSELETLCQNIAALRKVNGLTQKEFAQIMGVSVYCVRKLEQGSLPNNFYADSIIQLSRYCHLKPAALFSPMKLPVREP